MHEHADGRPGSQLSLRGTQRKGTPLNTYGTVEASWARHAPPGSYCCCMLACARGTLQALADMTDSLGATERGVFVTLMQSDQLETGELSLRGCMGCVQVGSCLGTDDQSFRSLLARAAALAATRDTRFAPVSKGELPRVSAEVAILSQPRAVAYGDIQVGDGVTFTSASGSRGVFLPDMWGTFNDKVAVGAALRAKGVRSSEVDIAAQVKREFMTALATEKAGVPKESLYERGAKFETFTAQVVIDSRSIGQCDD